MYKCYISVAKIYIFNRYNKGGYIICLFILIIFTQAQIVFYPNDLVLIDWHLTKAH